MRLARRRTEHRQRRYPALEFIEQGRRRRFHDLIGLHTAVVTKKLRHERDGHRFEQRHHGQGRDDLFNHLHGPRPGRDPTVTDEPNRLMLPFVVQKVDSILEGRILLKRFNPREE